MNEEMDLHQCISFCHWVLIPDKDKANCFLEALILYYTVKNPCAPFPCVVSQSTRC